MSTRLPRSPLACILTAILWTSCGPRETGVPERIAEFQSVHGTEADADAVRRAREGLFEVQGREVVLRTPVDWRMDPHSDRSWRFWLHSWTFLEPLLLAAANGDAAALELAVRIAVDWIGSNGLGTEGISEFAWYDMAVGARAPCLGFLARATRPLPQFDRERALLEQSAEEHGEWLADDEHYAKAHNHGLYEDAGLALLCMQLPELPLAGGWYRKAQSRFIENVGTTVQREDGFHLEHSPAYHTMILDLIARMSESARFDDGQIEATVRKMRERAPWLVLPDGRYAQLGDTDLVDGPAWIADERKPEGLLFARSTGLAAVASGDERLIAASWYHVRGHKHSDELSFVWFLEGHRFLVDAGRYGYYYTEPGRKYAESSASHNVLTRADMEFSFRGQKPYGSALSGVGRAGPWYVIVGTNPLLVPQGLEHRRAWIYRPGVCLYVCDFVERTAEGQVDLRRRFHFGPEVEVSADGDRAWRCDGRSGVLGMFHDLTEGGVSARAVRGQREPEVQGFTFPENRGWQANWCLELDSPRDADVLVGAFVIGGDTSRPHVQLSIEEGGAFRFRAEHPEAACDLRVGAPDEAGVLDVGLGETDR